MSCWLVEPRDPLIARDGRPANNLRFTTTRFPFPSMLAGAARTRMGSENGAFAVPAGNLHELKRVPVHGPLLAELETGSGAVLGWFAPAPRDAVLARPEKGEKRILRRRLKPRELASGERLDSLEAMKLLPVDAPGLGSDKPLSEAPAFWAWEELGNWLAAPQKQEGVVVPGRLGIPDLLREERTHLALQPGERVGMDGMIFSTSGLRFLHARKEEEEPKDAEKSKAEEQTLKTRRFALSLRSAGGTVDGRQLALREETAPLGGERRLARWSPASEGWPELPVQVLEKVVETGRARLILLTPAFFSAGALPGWSGGTWPLLPAVRVTVRAACVGRPEIVSGWDLAETNDSGGLGRPKPTRRLAGAGSVYFVEIQGSKDDVATWCRSVWLAPVNDPDPQSDPRNQHDLDGFGLAALGIWEES